MLTDNGRTDEDARKTLCLCRLLLAVIEPWRHTVEMRASEVKTFNTFIVYTYNLDLWPTGWPQKWHSFLVRLNWLHQIL